VKVAVTGKTGAGKTTVTALAALAAAAAGRRVLAVDSDPSPNLGLSLGVGAAGAGAARTVPRALATGRAGGGVSAAQLVAGYGVPGPPGVTLVHAMAAGDEVAGCGCPAHASARSVLGEALAEADVALIDLEGGLDHLDRRAGTLAHVDVLVVVAEASRKSVLGARRAVDQARQGGVGPVVLVGNKVRPGGDDEAVLAALADEQALPLAAVVPWSPEVFEADRAGTGLALWPGPVAEAAAALVRAAGLAPARHTGGP